MKEAIIHPGPRVEIIESPVPEPGSDQVVTKVVVSGSNPKVRLSYNQSTSLATSSQWTFGAVGFSSFIADLSTAGLEKR